MNDQKRNRPEHRTGRVPRFDFASLPIEPPQPNSLPEFSDPISSTGLMQIIGEGEDRAKQRDDSASSSQVDAGRGSR